MSLRPRNIEFDEAFSDIKNALDILYTASQSDASNSFSAIHIHELVFYVCSARPHSMTESLYTALCVYLQSICQQVFSRIMSADDPVRAYSQEWEIFAVASYHVDKLFSYLNKQIETIFLPQVMKLRSLKKKENKWLLVYPLAFQTWTDEVWNALQLSHHSNRVLRRMIETIVDHRNGKPVDLSPVQRVLNSLIELCKFQSNTMQILQNDFGPTYMTSSIEYYRHESCGNITRMSVSEFMRHAIVRLESEKERNVFLCSSLNLSVIMNVIYNEYIRAHKSTIEGYFDEALRKCELQDCINMFDLLGRLSDGHAEMHCIFESHIASIGITFLSELNMAEYSKDPTIVTDKLSTIYQSFVSLCRDSFSNDQLFLSAVDKALRKIVNDRGLKAGLKIAEALSKACDILLRKTQKSASMTEQEIESKIQNTVDLFKFIDDKDIFQKFYSRYLAKRLIHGTSMSFDLERNVIQSLKLSCGNEYTSKLQRMFTDMSISEDLNASFAEFRNKSPIHQPVETTFFILTSGSWPLSPYISKGPSIILPYALTKSMELFNAMYQSRHSGRKLIWQYSLCKGDVRLNGFDKRYEINMPLFCMLVLLQFNEKASLRMKDIQEQTLLTEVDLKNTLKSLLDFQLLIKVSPKDDQQLSAESIFQINNDFFQKKIKLKITAVAAVSDTNEERERTNRDIDEERKIFIQATIVRIMKSEKRIGHTELVTKVIEQTNARFHPDIQQIKRSIEHLIERQYMERDGSSNDTYLYIA